jgi:hypothetical protein
MGPHHPELLLVLPSESGGVRERRFQCPESRGLAKHMSQHEIALRAVHLYCHWAKVYRAEFVVADRCPRLGLAHVKVQIALGSVAVAALFKLSGAGSLQLSRHRLGGL